MEAFDLAAGLRVVGPAVGEADPAAGQGEFERDASAAAVGAGEHRAVVGQHRGRKAVRGSGFVEAGDDVGGLEHAPGVAGHAQPGVIVDDVQDFDVAAVSELHVGDVELPALVGLLGFKAH